MDIPVISPVRWEIMLVSMFNGTLPEFDGTCEVYYDKSDSPIEGEKGVVVRTVADGDELLPCARVRVVEFAVTDSSGKSDKTGKCAGSALPPKTRKTDSVRSQNTAAVRAIMVAFGYEGPITPQIRKVCLELLAREKAALGY